MPECSLAQALTGYQLAVKKVSHRQRHRLLAVATVAVVQVDSFAVVVAAEVALAVVASVVEVVVMQHSVVVASDSVAEAVVGC